MCGSRSPRSRPACVRTSLNSHRSADILSARTRAPDHAEDGWTWLPLPAGEGGVRGNAILLPRDHGGFARASLGGKISRNTWGLKPPRNISAGAQCRAIQRLDAFGQTGLLLSLASIGEAHRAAQQVRPPQIRHAPQVVRRERLPVAQETHAAVAEREVRSP